MFHKASKDWMYKQKLEEDVEYDNLKQLVVQVEKKANHNSAIRTVKMLVKKATSILINQLLIII